MIKRRGHGGGSQVLPVRTYPDTILARPHIEVVMACPHPRTRNTCIWPGPLRPWRGGYHSGHQMGVHALPPSSGLEERSEEDPGLGVLRTLYEEGIGFPGQNLGNTSRALVMMLQ